MGECRMPPVSAPPTPRAFMPPQVPPLPGLPAPSSSSGGVTTAMTVEEHERLMKAVIGPLEEKLNRLHAMYEGEKKDKHALLGDVNRLSGLVDTVLHRLALVGAIGGGDFKAIRAAMQGRTADG